MKNKLINGWYLFWLITAPISLAMIIAMMGKELNSGPAVSEMIQLSVRCAVPWIYLAFVASSVQVLSRGAFSLWLARNRKYLGLCFAAAMAWQGFFILWMVIVYSDYYINEVYVMRDAIEGVIGYLFLAAMTVTSFMPVRRHMSPKSWKLLHKSGIYFLWAYAFSVYWWNLFYYGSPVPLDYIYYWGGFAACVLRIAAWSKKRGRRPGGGGAMWATVGGFLLVGVGVAAAALGSLWQPAAEQYLYGYTLTRIPELYLPYWPFEPFLPLFAIALGAYLYRR